MYLILVQILLTGDKGVGKSTILDLFPGDPIIEVDLDLNEILKKQIDLSKIENLDQCILRVIDLRELIKKLDSYKHLLESMDIICIVTNSIRDNLDLTNDLLLKLKRKHQDFNYYIIANFQDRKELVLEVEKIEEILAEKTFGFSAIQGDSKSRIFSIIEDMVQKKLKEIDKKEPLPTNFHEFWSKIEEAKILEKQGNIENATKCFSNAASELKKINIDKMLNSKRENIESVNYLCKAWECLVNAKESEDSEMFLEAKGYFVRASEGFHDSKLKLLALGNSEFCSILKLGMEFKKSIQIESDKEILLEIQAILKKMAELYREGGFEKETNWALSSLSQFDTFIKNLKN